MRKIACILSVAAIVCLAVAPAMCEIVRRVPAPNIASLKFPLAGSLRTPQLLRSLNQQVTVEGFYFDGTIPMVIDNLERIGVNMMLPDDAYVLLVGPPNPTVKSGDRISVTGILTKPSAADPKWVLREPAVLKVGSSANIKIVTKSTRPIISSISPIGRINFKRPPKLALVERYAVLVVGGGNYASNYMRYWNELKCTYSLLIDKGYSAANIYVVYADGIGKDASTPVNYSATSANIATVFNQLATKMGSNDTLYIMLNDHGSYGDLDTNGDEGIDSCLVLWGEDMTDDVFAANLNKITRYDKMIIEMEQCYSGGFINDLTGRNRIIMSACSSEQPSWAMKPDYQWNTFTYWYLAALRGSTPNNSGAVNADANGDGDVCFVEAFNFARSNDHESEVPFYEDDGAKPGHSGNMPNTGDGTIGATVHL